MSVTIPKPPAAAVHPRSFLAVLATTTCLVVSVASSAPAQVVCGDTLGPGGSVTLTADIATCAGAGAPALTIVGPVRVDLGGFQIKCTGIDPADGVEVLGTGARIENGSIRSCGLYALKLAGGGTHSVTNVAARSSTGHGFLVESDRNTLIGVSATNNGGAGVAVTGASTSVRSSVATNNNDQGVLITGDRNKLDRVGATNNTKEGVLVSGTGNRIRDLVVTTSGRGGLEVSGTENKVNRVTTARNSQHGVSVLGSENSFKEVAATHNGGRGYDVSAGTDNSFRSCSATSNSGDGFRIETDGNALKRNRSVNNGGDGFEAGAVTGGKIERGWAFENGGLDMRDTDACAGTNWSRNSFRTSNEPCIE